MPQELSISVCDHVCKLPGTQNHLGLAGKMVMMMMMGVMVVR